MCRDILRTRTGRVNARVRSHLENLVYIHPFCRVCPGLCINNYTCACRRCRGCITLTFGFPPCQCAWLSPRPIYPVPVVEATELKSNIPAFTITYLLLTLTKQCQFLENEMKKSPRRRSYARGNETLYLRLEIVLFTLTYAILKQDFHIITVTEYTVSAFCEYYKSGLACLSLVNTFIILHRVCIYV